MSPPDLQTSFRFHVFPPVSFFCSQFQPRISHYICLSCPVVSPNLWQFLGFSSFFMILTLRRALVTYLIDCPSAWVIWCFLMVKWRPGFGGRPSRWSALCSTLCQRNRTLICPISRDVGLDPLLKVVSAGLFRCKIIYFFAFVINKYFGEAKILLLFRLQHRPLSDLCLGSLQSPLFPDSALLLHGDALSFIFPQFGWRK